MCNLYVAVAVAVAVCMSLAMFSVLCMTFRLIVASLSLLKVFTLSVYM